MTQSLEALLPRLDRLEKAAKRTAVLGELFFQAIHRLVKR